MQYFKGDETEIKAEAVIEPIASQISLQKDLFFAGAYSVYTLGDLLWDLGISPLSNAIDRTIFRETYPQIFDAFVVAGTFESYITVFKKIFGDDVVVEFEVPAPGKLVIDITATGLEISKLVARSIVGNTYHFDYIVTELGDNIVVQTVKGFETQYELEQMLHEMVPAGIWTDISLSVG